MNTQVGCPKVYSEGCLKFRMELGVKSRTGQAGAALLLLPDFITKRGGICISCISAWPIESLCECMVVKLNVEHNNFSSLLDTLIPFKYIKYRAWVPA